MPPFFVPASHRRSPATSLRVKSSQPLYTVPHGQTPKDPGFALVADKAFVDRAHALGLKVIPDNRRRRHNAGTDCCRC